MILKKVKQENTNGCGIACAASFVNKSYKEVKKKFFPDMIATDFDDIKRCLDKHKLEYSKVIELKNKPKSGELAWNRLKNNALVAIKKPKNKYNHFVIYDSANHRVMDPQTTKDYRPITDKRMKIDSYMYVKDKK